MDLPQAKRGRPYLRQAFTEMSITVSAHVNCGRPPDTRNETSLQAVCSTAIRDGDTMRDRLAFIAPMMPTLVDLPPKDGHWLTEVKFDGWRCQLVIDSYGVRVFTRRGFDWSDKLKFIAEAAAGELKVKSAIIDGELVYPHETGHSDFPRPDGSGSIAIRQARLDGVSTCCI